jgi:hypothetical protein
VLNIIILIAALLAFIYAAWKNEARAAYVGAALLTVSLLV